jgi:hypothetical protein
MNRNKLLLAFGIGLLFALAAPVEAAKISFSPATGTFAVSSPMKIDIVVDTEGIDTMSTDAVILYDNKMLKLDTVTYGSFYGTVLHSEKTNKILISGMVSDATKVVSGTGTLASITFTPLTNGTATLTFDCTAGKTDDTNVAKNDLNASDIVSCSSLVAGSYTIGNGTTAATPTTAAAVTPNQNIGGGNVVPTAIPQTGALDILPLLPKIAMGVMFILLGLVPFLII